MFSDFTPFTITTAPGIDIHGIKSGTGPPLLLLHGFPQTHHIWHLITPHLTSHFTLILIDLRGYGSSSKPPSTLPNHATYSKSSMALDCVSVMTSLGFEKFNVLSHDRGARVGHQLCINHPEKVTKVMLLDICPTLSMFANTDQEFATAYWHWFFLIQPSPFPENLILANPELFREKFFGGGYAGPSAGGKAFWDAEAMAEYVKLLRDEETVKAMCEDYRAAATVDLVEQKRDRDQGRKIMCDLHVLWGKKGVIERSFDALKEWRVVCEGLVTGEGVDSGHYIAEEVPDVVVKHVLEFFG